MLLKVNLHWTVSPSPHTRQSLIATVRQPDGVVREINQALDFYAAAQTSIEVEEGSEVVWSITTLDAHGNTSASERHSFVASKGLPPAPASGLRAEVRSDNLPSQGPSGAVRIEKVPPKPEPRVVLTPEAVVKTEASAPAPVPTPAEPAAPAPAPEPKAEAKPEPAKVSEPAKTAEPVDPALVTKSNKKASAAK